MSKVARHSNDPKAADEPEEAPTKRHKKGPHLEPHPRTAGAVVSEEAAEKPPVRFFRCIQPTVVDGRPVPMDRLLTEAELREYFHAHLSTHVGHGNAPIVETDELGNEIEPTTPVTA